MDEQQQQQALLNRMARQDFEIFVSCMREDYDATDFHRVLLQLFDKFAHGIIRKMIVQVSPQHGKALQVDTPVLTTQGWKRHGDLAAGDYVFGEDGKPKRVIMNSGAYQWHTMNVDFADGFSMMAAPEHEWLLYCDRDDHRERHEEILETQQIFERRQRRNPFAKADAVIDMPPRKLPVEPYLLGYWLGDGMKQSAYICSGEEDAWNLAQFGKVRKEPYHKTPYYIVLVKGLAVKLRKMGLKNNKHIPIEYLLSSREQRLALLQGLMDTDGCVDKRGKCEFCQMKGKLADDTYTLIRSLGYKPTRHEYSAKLYGRECGKKVRICFVPNKGDKIFRLPRKQERIDNKTTADRADKTRMFITGVSKRQDDMVNCIEVEGGMYLAGHELVPTHNSELSSRMLPAFMLGLNPDLKIGLGSYAATIARDFNRDVQRIIDTDEYKAIFPDTFLNGSNVVTMANNYLRNSDVIEMVGHRGSFRVVGRGGSLTSKTIDVMILDDVYKDYAEGNSPVVRESAWKWYTSVVRTRLHNDSQELIVFTRWHEDDIIGMIEKSDEQIIDVKQWSDIDDIPQGAWVRVNFEALKTGAPTELDTRSEGEPLWPARHSKEELISQRDLDPVMFQCLYQGNPSSAEGRLYAHPFKTYVTKEDYGAFIRSGNYTDVADEGDDFMASVCYDIYKSPNDYYNEQKRRFEPLLFALVTDIEYTDENTEITSVTVPAMINRNGTQRAWIESNNGGSGFEKLIRPKMRANTVPFYQGANKESRIVSNAAVVNSQVIMPFGWESRWPKAADHLTRFLRNFSANAHDDIEDCLTGIVEKEIIDGNIQPYGGGSRGVRVH